MSEFKSSSIEEFICISYYDTEDLPIDRHCIKYRNIKYDIQEVLERTDDIDYVISDSKTTRNLLKENAKLKERILTLEETIRRANNNVLKDIAMIKTHEMIKQEIVQRLFETSKMLEKGSD